MKIITVKRVQIFADIGDQNTFDCSTSIPDAELRAAHPGCHISEVSFVIYESARELNINAADALRNAALAKLTDVDRHALGILPTA